MSSITAAEDGGVVLPTGTVMTAQELDDLIDRMLDLNRKIQDAWRETAQVLSNDIKREDEGKELQTKCVKMSATSTGPTAALTRPISAQSRRITTNERVQVSGLPIPQAPGDDLTGVPYGLLRLCATISNQIYSANELADFNLTNPANTSITANAIMFENHGSLKDVIPPFCVAVAHKCLILAWRGSSSIMDWASDFGAAPVSSTRWNKVSSQVRAHSAYTSLDESELVAYEDFLLKEISSRKIDTVLLTGHSLGGGMAQVAHLMLEGQLRTSGTPWNQLKQPLAVKSVSFAAPMTTLVTTAISGMDDPTRNLLTKIANHSCNIVYGPDIVPHGPGDIEYVINTGHALVPGAIASLPSHLVLQIFGAQRWLNSALDDLSRKPNVEELKKVLFQYQHVGKVIYYPVGELSPVVLRDCQEFLPQSLPTFRTNPTVVKLPTANGWKASIAELLKSSHKCLLLYFAYNPGTRVKRK